MLLHSEVVFTRQPFFSSLYLSRRKKSSVVYLRLSLILISEREGEASAVSPFTNIINLSVASSSHENGGSFLFKCYF